jgi:hypothetical protein
MGSYTRKMYKKKSIDLFHKKGLECDIKKEVDLFYNNKEEDDIIFLFEDYPIMFDEPDIVRELKEEERSGKLQTYINDIPYKKKQYSRLPILENFDILEGNIGEIKKSKNTSYNNELELAKKILKKISRS